MENIKLLKGIKTLAITCRQWGDTGKGKFVDFFTDWADIVVRGTGGDNAGHTISYKGQELITHLVPSGILHDSQGKINVIGNGVVIYPPTLSRELKQLKTRGITYNHLKIAFNAHLITPAEIVLDRIKENVAGPAKIGSTGKGIGPAYTDFVSRQGLRLNDLLNPKFFTSKLKRHLELKKRILKNYNSTLLKSIMSSEHLISGLYYDAKEIFNFQNILDSYLDYGKEFKPLITDTDSFIRSQLGHKNILAEGAQGDLLSIKFGTYPFVTSSDPTIAGLAEGIGLQSKDIDLSLGIIKGFYMTRVGSGPFPTELGGLKSAQYCSGDMNKEKELASYGSPDINSQDEFQQSIALRQAGYEYGATTGRLRRVGYLDLPLLRYVMSFNSPDIILTKLDVLNNLKTIKIAKAYHYQGPDFYYAGRLIKSGSYLHSAIADAEVLKYCFPVYTEFPGWRKSLDKCTNFASLPSELKNILDYIVSQTGIKPRLISIGPDRQETIIL